jgi:hypothetical protein
MRTVAEAAVMHWSNFMESNNHTADTLEAWNEFYSALKGAARERSLEFRRTRGVQRTDSK